MCHRQSGQEVRSAIAPAARARAPRGLDARYAIYGDIRPIQYMYRAIAARYVGTTDTNVKRLARR